jgi:hypothetical protein
MCKVNCCSIWFKLWLNASRWLTELGPMTSNVYKIMELQKKRVLCNLYYGYILRNKTLYAAYFFFLTLQYFPTELLFELATTLCFATEL